MTETKIKKGRVKRATMQIENCLIKGKEFTEQQRNLYLVYMCVCYLVIKFIFIFELLLNDNRNKCTCIQNVYQQINKQIYKKRREREKKQTRAAPQHSHLLKETY